MPCYLIAAGAKGLIDPSSGVNWLDRSDAEGSDPVRWEVTGGEERRGGLCQSGVTQTWKCLGEGESFLPLRLRAHVQIPLAYYHAGDADERWEWAHRLWRLPVSFFPPFLSLLFFFIRLFQTLNVSLYNSSQPLQLPRVPGSSLGEETANP